VPTRGAAGAKSLQHKPAARACRGLWPSEQGFRHALGPDKSPDDKSYAFAAYSCKATPTFRPFGSTGRSAANPIAIGGFPPHPQRSLRPAGRARRISLRTKTHFILS